MSETRITVDAQRAAALEAAVSGGAAVSVQAAIESAVDSWLTDQALDQLSDEALQKLWREGIESGDAGVLDVAALKAEARRAP